MERQYSKIFLTISVLTIFGSQRFFPTDLTRIILQVITIGYNDNLGSNDIFQPDFSYRRKILL